MRRLDGVGRELLLRHFTFHSISFLHRVDVKIYDVLVSDHLIVAIEEVSVLRTLL